MSSRELIIFGAHLDDIEFSCLGFLLKNSHKYDTIKIIIATTWENKVDAFEKNLLAISEKIKHKISYSNLNFRQRELQNNFDHVKSAFYHHVDFGSKFDILTHDRKDAHSDHKAVHDICYGLYKHAQRFVTYYSPSSVKFFPNYYITISKEDYEWKNSLLAEYDIEEEQSFSKKGNYFRRKYTNITSMYCMENFVDNQNDFCEVYKIYKWME